MSPQPGYQVPGRAPVESFPDSGYWNQQFRSEPYFLEGDSYDDYEPAYRLGYQGRGRYADRPWEQAEAELRNDWESLKGQSRLTWEQARLASQAAWHRVERALPGDADGDGR